MLDMLERLATRRTFPGFVRGSRTALFCDILFTKIFGGGDALRAEQVSLRQLRRSPRSGEADEDQAITKDTRITLEAFQVHGRSSATAEVISQSRLPVSVETVQHDRRRRGPRQTIRALRRCRPYWWWSIPWPLCGH